MAYESASFVEHHSTRLPILESLLKLGWAREQIQCPSKDLDGRDEKEWRVPQNPSAAAAREKGGPFRGFPVDIAIFDSESCKGQWQHAKIIIECKEPGERTGLSELEIYMGLEPKVQLGILTDGTRFTRVYKRPSGEFEVVKGSTLPAPGENLIRSENVNAGEMSTPTLAELKSCFKDLLALIVSQDGRTTRADARLSQLCNLLLVKLQSDLDARLTKKRDSVDFQISDTPEETAATVNALFKRYKADRRELFTDDEPDSIQFEATTIHAIVAELQRKNLICVKPETLSMAFQIFRSENLKNGDGQYFTPSRVIKAATRMMCVDSTDKVIDPACGTGGFLGEVYLQVARNISEADAVRWANAKLYGVDLDNINVKLARALMVGMGDGSTHVKLGDSIKQSSWESDRHAIADALADDSYDVVLTNPPFGKDLVMSAHEASCGQYEICKHTKTGKFSDSYSPTEIGIVFVERAYRLLHEGGRLGIVLPETYFFSKSYEWFRAWLDDKFELKGVLNIPMEAFQGFCRAKTNFYVLVKKRSKPCIGAGVGPDWIRAGLTWVSNAPTIGINKDGNTLYRLDPVTLKRTDEVDDAAQRDVDCLLEGDGETRTASYAKTVPLSSSCLGVPRYCDRTAVGAARDWFAAELPGCDAASLGQLADVGLVEYRTGHGSPGADLRIGGEIPYIKVSDIRNGQVNPNSTNQVSFEVAKRYWKADESGILPWDVVMPSRASKNIGEPAVVLPGEEHAVFTKEILVLRTSAAACFDNFFLAWSLLLPKVQKQWDRVVFMQTNREDLGDRWREIVIPVPKDRVVAERYSRGVEKYYTELARIRDELHREMKNWE